MISRKNFKISVFITIFLLLITFAPQTSSAASINIVALIDDAFYADLDGENDTYDIQFNVSVSILNFKGFHRWYGYKLVLYTGLEYPSGQEYWYQIDILSYMPYFELKFQFEDAATESGFYTAHLISHSSQMNEDYVIYNTYIFDPPGGGAGAGPPSLTIS